jgi:hypothetical protein
MKVLSPWKRSLELLIFKTTIMNFQTMSRQRKFILISAAVGFISMFLPWLSISILGFHHSVNGMHEKGVIVFFCFIAAGVLAYIGDQKSNVDTGKWTLILAFGTLAFLLILWFYSQASDSIMGASAIGYGLYLAALASIGILVSTYVFRSPDDNLKDGFGNLKSNFTKKSDRNSTSTSVSDLDKNPFSPEDQTTTTL